MESIGSTVRRVVNRPPAVARRRNAARRSVVARPAVTRPTVTLAAVSGVVLVALILGVGAARAAATTAADRPGDSAGTDDGAAIAGVVVDHEGQPRLGVIVQLYATGIGDQPDRHLRPAYTGADGRYRMEDLPADCYTVVVEAPAGATFADGAEVDHHDLCLDPGQSDDSLRSVTARPPADELEGGAEQSTGPGATLREPTLSVEIIHLGHHLGRLEPSIVRLEMAGLITELEAGGWARVVSAILAERSEPGGESTFTIHTGGVLGGSALSTVFGGAADAALMNRVCFDVVAPGPNDLRRRAFDAFRGFLGDGPCATELLLPDGPTVSGPSVGRDGSGTPGVAVRPIGDRVVAFVTVADRPGSAADPEAATADRVERLVAEGVDEIVLLSELGTDRDRRLVRRLPGVDAVIGGGPDGFLGDLGDLAPGSGEGDGEGGGEGGGDPMIEINADGDPVCLGYGGADALTVGVLQVAFDDQGRAASCDGRTTLLLGRQMAIIDPETGERRSPTDDERRAVIRAVADDPGRAIVDPDEATSQVQNDWWLALDALIDEPIGTVGERLCLTSVPGRRVGLLCGSDLAVGDTAGPRSDAQRLVAEAIRSAGESMDDESGTRAGAGPVLAIIASGTIDRGFEPGPLTLADLFRVVPGDRNLVRVVVTGTELATILEEGVAAAVDGRWVTSHSAAAPDVPPGTGRPGPESFPHTAGVRWVPDYAAPTGSRIRSIEVRAAGRQGREPHGQGWEPVAPDARYVVVTTDSLVRGPGAYPTLAAAANDGRATTTSVGATEAVLRYIEESLGGVIAAPGNET